MRDFDKLGRRVCGTSLNHGVDYLLILLTDKVNTARCAYRNICTAVHFICSIYFGNNRTKTPRLNSLIKTRLIGIYQKFRLDKIQYFL